MVEGLTAEYGLDFDAWEGGFELPGGGLSLGFLNVATPIEGDDMAGAGVGSDDCPKGDFMDVFADGGQDAVEKSDDLTLRDGLAVHFCVSVGGGDFDGVDILNRVLHSPNDLGAGEFRHVGEESGYALGLTAGGNNVEGLVGDF